MSQKEAPSHIRVHGRLYRRANPDGLRSRAQRMVGQLAHILDVAADDADNLRRVLDQSGQGNVSHYLTELAAPMEAVDKSFRRAVRSLVRAGLIDMETASAYFPWVERMDSSEPSKPRPRVEGEGVTDYHAPPGTQSVNDTLYPLPLKNLHWSNVPTAVKVRGHIYRRTE